MCLSTGSQLIRGGQIVDRNFTPRSAFVRQIQWKSCIAVFCLAIVFCVGCASYTARQVPTPEPEAMSAWRVQGQLAVGAEPYVDADRQIAVFDTNLTEVGILAIQVLIQNRGEQTILVNSLKFTLRLPSGHQIAPVEARAVVSKLEPRYGAGFDRAAVAFGLIGAVVAMSAASASEKAQEDRHVDYAAKELRKVVVAKGESTHGFVYFMLPPGITAIKDATLTVPCFTGDETSSVIVNLLLSGRESK